MTYVDTNGFSNGFGICDVPYETVEAAHDITEPGSILYLAPGIYDRSAPMILWKPMTLTTTGTAVIR